MKRAIYFAAIAFLVTGCLGTSPNIGSVKPTASAKNIELDKDYVFRRTIGLADVPYEIRLSKGRYVLTKESDTGFFFEGAGRCLTKTIEQGRRPVMREEGGIFVAKPPSREIRTWFNPSTSRLTSDTQSEMFTYPDIMRVVNEDVRIDNWLVGEELESRVRNQLQ